MADWGDPVCGHDLLRRLLAQHAPTMFFSHFVGV
jgi:hypothetical protein